METTHTLTAQAQHNELSGVGSSPTSSCSYQNAEHAALAYRAAGLSVIPLKGDKSPTLPTWTEYQSAIPTEEQISRWYARSAIGVGIICGAISGNIECLDVDEKYNVDDTPLLSQLASLVDAQASGLLSRLVHESSVNRGHHFVYRCTTISGSKNLARRMPTDKELKEDPKLKSQVLIETRGEGAYFACYPTPGYALLSGSFTAIPEISSSQWNPWRLRGD